MVLRRAGYLGRRQDSRYRIRRWSHLVLEGPLWRKAKPGAHGESGRSRRSDHLPRCFEIVESSRLWLEERKRASLGSQPHQVHSNDLLKPRHARPSARGE